MVGWRLALSASQAAGDAAARPGRDRDVPRGRAGVAGTDQRGVAEGGGALGILLPSVQHGEDVDRLADAVDEDIVGVDDRLARAGDAAGAVEEWMVGEAIGSVPDRRAEAVGRRGVAIRDVAGDVVQVSACVGEPDQRQRHRCLARSMIACISAIT